LNSKIENIHDLNELLKHSNEPEFTNRLVYNIPKKYLDFLKKHNLQFSNFMIEAMQEKIKQIEQKKDT
jgi:signal-transduction protein with cAMP-binding, CBS, and nucleotidyltransferase domain